MLEFLREEKTIAQMAFEYGVHPTQLHRWKKQVLERLPELFKRDDRQERAEATAHERQLEDLYAQIGRLTAHWFSQFAVSCELSKSLEVDFVLSAIDRALLHETPRKYATRIRAVNLPACSLSKGSWRLERW